MPFASTKEHQKHDSLGNQNADMNEQKNGDPLVVVPRTASLPLMVPPPPRSIIRSFGGSTRLSGQGPAGFQAIWSDSETETEPELKFPFKFLHHSHPHFHIDQEASSSIPIYKGPVFLESLLLSSNKPLTLVGSVLVKNLAFNKNVIIRFTLDDWKTASEVECRHVDTLSIAPLHGSEMSGEWDRFSFSINMEDHRHGLEKRTLLLAVKYEVADLGQWWDNNDEKNYTVRFKRIDKPMDCDCIFPANRYLHKYATLPPPAPDASPKPRRASFSSGSSGGSPSSPVKLVNYAPPLNPPTSTPHASIFRGRASRRALSMGPVFAGHPVSILKAPAFSLHDTAIEPMVSPPAPKGARGPDDRISFTNYAPPGDKTPKSDSSDESRRRFSIGPLIGPLIAGQPTTLHPTWQEWR